MNSEEQEGNKISQEEKEKPEGPIREGDNFETISAQNGEMKTRYNG